MEEDDFIIVTCGNWDLGSMLPSECKMKGIQLHSRYPYYSHWIDLKGTFRDCYSSKTLPPYRKMLDALGLKMEGRHHSGKDDARNMVNIVFQMVEDGFLERFEVNASCKDKFKW